MSTDLRDWPVLIIDDSESDRYLLRRQLKRAAIGNLYIEASDGRAAIDLLQEPEALRRRYPAQFPPLLAFLDINMPRLDGFGFLDEFSAFRTELGYDRMVVLMFSSSQLDSDIERSKHYAFVRGYIPKMPDSAEHMRSQVEAALAQNWK